MSEIEQRLADTLQNVLSTLEETARRVEALEASPRSDSSSPEQRKLFWAQFQASLHARFKEAATKPRIPPPPACMECSKAGLVISNQEFLVYCGAMHRPLPVSSNSELETPSSCSLRPEPRKTRSEA